MSAIKKCIDSLDKFTNDERNDEENRIETSLLAGALCEIIVRLKRLEAQAHSHKATSDHETCIHRSNCKIYNTPCDYKPDTVQLASQSPAADLQNIPQGTLYVGDTERSCDNCTEYAICANSTPFDNTYANKCDSFNPKQPCAEQDTERSCDDCDHSCSTCLFEKYADKEEPCYSCILEGYNGHKDGWQPKQPRAEQDDRVVIGDGVDLRSGKVEPVKIVDISDKVTEKYEATIADLRASLDEAERIARENGELALARKVEIERLEKENEELRRIFPAICASLGNGACCSESSSVEFLREIPNEVSAVIKKMTAENEELKRDLKATRDAIDMKRKEVK